MQENSQTGWSYYARARTSRNWNTDGIRPGVRLDNNAGQQLSVVHGYHEKPDLEAAQRMDIDIPWLFETAVRTNKSEVPGK